MNRETALTKLKALQNNVDQELEHIYADKILCELLKSLGYKDVVSEYHKIKKWYS